MLPGCAAAPPLRQGRHKRRLACIAAAPSCPQKRMQRRDGTMMTLAQSKRANELQKDMNAWEENRLMTSGQWEMLMSG